MTAAPHEVLDAGRAMAQMSLEDLWLAYFALGGAAPPDELERYLAGGAGPMDYDVVAQAINERFIEGGANHPVPYYDELENEGDASH